MSKKQRVEFLKQRGVTAVLIFLIISVGTFWVLADQMTDTQLFEGGMSGSTSYVIFNVGANYYYKSGKTGAVSAGSTNFETVAETVSNTLLASGGKIFLQSGDYGLPANSPWNITSNDIILEGEGRSSRIFTQGTQDYNAITIGTEGSVTSGVEIRHIMIDGMKSGKTTSGEACANGLIRLLRACHNITIEYNYLENGFGCAFTSDPSGTLAGRHDNIIYHGNVIYNFEDTDAGLCDTGGDFHSVDRAVITENRIDFADQGGIHLADNRWSTVSNNVISAVKNGIGLSYANPHWLEGSMFCTVSGNTISDVGWKGIYLYGQHTEKNSIVGNTISGLYTGDAQAGIIFWTEAGNNNTCVGNTVWGNDEAGSTGILEMAGWDFNIILGNIVNYFPLGIVVAGGNTINQHNQAN